MHMLRCLSMPTYALFYAHAYWLEWTKHAHWRFRTSFPQTWWSPAAGWMKLVYNTNQISVKRINCLLIHQQNEKSTQLRSDVVSVVNFPTFERNWLCMGMHNRPCMVYYEALIAVIVVFTFGQITKFSPCLIFWKETKS